MMTLTGKGYFIWMVRHCEKGDPDRIAALAKEANLTHVLIKVADGAFPYNIDLENGFDYVRPVVKKLHSQNISVWGWHYVYGDYPEQEAEIAVKRSLELGLDGYVVNAEAQYKTPAKAPAASRYMRILRSNLGTTPLALSSYRFPSFHMDLPWKQFLERCDYNMPQIYWMKSHNNAGAQLQRCINEFRNIHPHRPIIPTGPTFKEHGWIPQKSELIEFLQVARKLRIPAVNFWFWEGCRRDLPHFWDIVRDYPFDAPSSNTSLPGRYIDVINSMDVSKLLNLYSDSAVHIRREGVIQGKQAIHEYFSSFINLYADCVFSLLSESNNGSVFNFQWRASDKTGARLMGRDTIGLSDQKIRYHYSFIKEI